MSKRYRTILWTFFIVGFLVSAPLIVLYTAGYRYSFLAGRVVERGLFSIATLPKSANIYIDNELPTK